MYHIFNVPLITFPHVVTSLRLNGGGGHTPMGLRTPTTRHNPIRTRCNHG